MIHSSSMGGLMAVALAVMTGAAAQARTAREIVDEQTRRHQTDSEYLRTEMTLVSREGDEKQRVVHTWSLKSEAGTRILTKFSDPPDIRNVGTLTWEQTGGREDDQWLYLPELRRVKRITGGSKKGMFMGTDIAFEDMRPEDQEDYTYTLLREEPHEGEPCWVIQREPATEEERRNSGYVRTIRWLDQAHYRQLKTEYYGPGDRLVKTAISSDWRNLNGSVWRPFLTEVSRVQTGTRTRMRLTEAMVNEGVEATLLTNPGLQRPLSLQ